MTDRGRGRRPAGRSCEPARAVLAYTPGAVGGSVFALGSRIDRSRRKLERARKSRLLAFLRWRVVACSFVSCRGGAFDARRYSAAACARGDAAASRCTVRNSARRAVVAARALRARPLPARRAPAAGRVGGPHPLVRRMFSCAWSTIVPGVLMRVEGQPPCDDAEANRAFDAAGAVHAFWREVFERDSIDGRGMHLIAFGSLSRTTTTMRSGTARRWCTVTATGS